MKKESSRSLFWVIFPFLTAEEHGDDHVELIRRLNGLSGLYFVPIWLLENISDQKGAYCRVRALKTGIWSVPPTSVALIRGI